MSQTEVQLIKDAVIVNADISNSAAIDVSKISGAMPLTGGTITGDVTFDGETAGRDIVFDRSENSLEFADNAKLKFGNGGDLEIYHSGSSSVIGEIGTGNLTINSTSLDFFNNDLGGSYARFISNGAAELYHAGAKKFETTSAGGTLSGTLSFPDGDAGTNTEGGIKLGASGDLHIYHDGNNSHIKETGTGDLIITGKNNITFLDYGTNETMAKMTSEGAVELYYDNVKQLSTRSDGIEVHAPEGGEAMLYLTADEGDDDNDKYRIVAQNGGDLVFQRHNGSAYSSELRLKSAGGMQLNFQGSNKLETISAGITVTGNVLPDANNTRDLGSSSLRWSNLYTNDLNLSNEGSSNDVDGTWGNYTIQEGAEDLFLINKRNGKKYKFNLTEVG